MTGTTTQTHGYWEPHTGSVNWCEADYVFFNVIAELANTSSSLAMCTMGLCGWRLHPCAPIPFKVLFVAIGIVGIGSALFHMTLSYEMQMMDELPMLFVVGLLYDLLREAWDRRTPSVRTRSILIVHTMAIIGLVSTTNGRFQFYAFHITFGSLEIACTYLLFQIYRRRVREGSDATATALFTKGFMIYVLGGAAWLIDMNLCKYVNGGPSSILPFDLYLHAWWHLAASCGLYLLTLFVLVERSGLHAALRFSGHLLPFVKIEN